MTKDEALDLALEALEEAHHKVEHKQDAAKREQAITAIKQVRALDKKAENARELGLDYEPADGTQVSKVWWDGEKLMAKPIPLVDFYQPAPVQSCYCPNCEAIGRELAALKAQPAPVQEPEIDGATMAGMDASIGHLSALVDELRLLLGCAMDNFKMLHNAAKPDDGPDMDAIIPAIVFAKFVNQDAALRYAIKHSAHDGMITTPPAAQPAVPDAMHHTDMSKTLEYIQGWNACRQAMLEMMK